MKAKLCFKLISAAEYRKNTCFAAMCLSTSAQVRRLKCLQRLTNINIISTREAKVAELVDAADSKSAASDSVWVRVPSLAPLHKIKKSSSGAFFCLYVVSSKTTKAAYSQALTMGAQSNSKSYPRTLTACSTKDSIKTYQAVSTATYIVLSAKELQIYCYEWLP